MNFTIEQRIAEWFVSWWLMVGIIALPILLFVEYMNPGTIREYKTKIQHAYGTVYVDMANLRFSPVTIRKNGDRWCFDMDFEYHSYGNLNKITLEYDSLEAAEAAVEKLVKWKAM